MLATSQKLRTDSEASCGVSLPRVGRRLHVPRWAVVVVLLWLCLVGLCELLEPADTAMPSLCHLKAVTGIPCPTCGTTRAVKAAATGRLVQAWLMNPFVVTTLAIGGLWLAWRITTGRAILLRLQPRMRTTMWAVIGVLFVVNWGFLLWRGI